MVPDKFNMVDMGGIDLIESQGVAVEGLYQKLVESITLCRYQCLYNWKFNGILIPPSYVETELREDEVWINEGVSVDEEDVIHIYSIEPEPPAPILPVIEALQVTENGTYQAPEGIDGYNPVEVSVSMGSRTYTGSTVPSESLGNDGDWYIQENFGARITRLGFDTGINVADVYGFKYVFQPLSGITPYQSYLLANLDNFTVGRTGYLTQVYIRIAGVERLVYSTTGLSTIEAKNGVLTADGRSATYTSTSPLGTSANIYIGAKTSDRYSDFLFVSLELYDSNFDIIDTFTYDSVNNQIVGSNGALTPTGSGEISDYSAEEAVYHKENGTWVEY